MQRPVEDRDARVAEVLDEYLAAARAGRPPDREALLAANEDLRKPLDAALRALEFVGRAGDEIAGDEERGAPLPVGTIGDFRLIREVGRGGMGVVYEAEQVSLSRRVALKVLPFASVLDPRQLQRFRHEAHAAALLHHTNIVPVHSVGTERGVHYYAMEFVEGRTLAAVIHELRGWRRPGSAGRARTSRPSPRRARESPESSAEVRVLTPDGSTETPEYCRAIARLGVQAAEALDHAHAHDVIHRDIKPANLMVDAEARLWITDFGLARSRVGPQVTLTGSILGTLGYMSPEQALGKRVPVDHRTDVYSLGVTLMEALTLEPVFPGEDPRQVIQDIAFRSPPPPRRANAAVPRAFETILLKAVAKDPESRYATAGEMAQDLRRLLADEPIRARREPILDRVTLWARRHRAAVAAGACVLVIAVVALGVDVVRVGAQRKRAEDAAAEARSNAARAEANLAKAREAIDEMLTQVGAKELVGVPGVERVGNKLLEKAAALYEAMLASAGDDERTRLEAARAFVRIADRSSSTEASERYAERARSLLVALAPEDGPWHPALDELAHVERYRTGLLHRTGRPADAVPVVEHAVALAERGARERPDDPHMNPCLSEILGEQCLLLLGVGRHAEAAAAGRRAVRIQEIAIERAPDDQGLHEGLGNRLSRLGEVLRAMGSTAATEEVWRRAIQELEPAASQSADSNGFRRRAEVHLFLADFLLERSRLDEALPLLRVAAEAAVRFASEFPTYVEGHVDAAARKGFLAAALFRAGHGKEAEEALADTLTRYDRLLARSRGRPEIHAQAAHNLLVLGNHLGDAGRDAEAEAAYRRGADLCRERARTTPDRAAVHEELAGLLCNWISQGRRRLAPDEVVRLCSEAVTAAVKSVALPDSVPKCSETLAWALSNFGAVLPSQGADYDGAESAYRSATEAFGDLVSRAPDLAGPRKALALARLGWARALARSGKLDEAEPLMRQALAAFEPLAAAPPGDVEHGQDFANAAWGAADIETMSGRFPEAEALARRGVAAMERVVSASPHTTDLRRILAEHRSHLAQIQLAGGRGEDAERTLAETLDELRRTLRDAPTDNLARRSFVEIAHWRCRVLVETGRPQELSFLDEAVRFAEEAVSAQPSSANRDIHLRARLYRGQALRLAGRAEEAEREFRTVVDLAASYETADGAGAHREPFAASLWNLARVHKSAGRDRDAIEALERALAVSPYLRQGVVSLILELGDAADPACRDPRRAVEVARDAIAHVPPKRPSEFDLDAGSAWNLLGFALLCDGRWKEGIEAAARSVDLGYREDGTDWIYYALAHAKLGDLPAARDFFDRAVAWFAEHPSPDERFARRRAEVERLLAETKAR